MFDYNINHYEKNELEDFFELKENEYDINLIENKKNRIKNGIVEDISINEKTKEEIYIFLDKAKDKLITYILPLSQIKTVKHNKLENAIQDLFKKYSNQDVELKQNEVIDAGSTFLIEKKPEPYTLSKPSEYYRGSINPLEIRTYVQNITIDTRFRENYYLSQSTNFLIDLPIKFSNVMTMQLTSVEFPQSFYNQTITDDNNFFSVIINDVVKVLTIPSGNYTSQDALLYLNAYVLSLEPPFSYLVFNLSLTQTGTSSGSGKMIISLNSTLVTEPFNFTLDFQADINGNPDYSTPLPLKLGWIFGFREGVYENNSCYVSEGIVDFIGRRYVFLSVDEFCNNKADTYFSAFNKSLLNKNILGRISCEGGNFSYQSNILSRLNANRRNYFGAVNITKLKIQLLDEYGKVINLNNMDYSLSLDLYSAYNNI